MNLFTVWEKLLSLILGLTLSAGAQSGNINFTYISPQNEHAPVQAAVIHKEIRLPIFMYHYVENIKNSKDKLREKMNVKPDIFEKQLKDLQSAEYETVFVKDLGNYFEKGELLPTKAVTLTFDDGYRDFYADVFPLLKKYRAKATLYVIADYVGAPAYVTRDEIKEMVASGLVEIGAHTLNHVDLKKVEEKKMKEEIFKSKEKLEKLTGEIVGDFAYPYGSFNEKAIEMVKMAGYKTAVTVNSGSEQKIENRFTLFRLRPGLRTGKNLTGWLEKYK